jgi:hypothetical protein
MSSWPKSAPPALCSRCGEWVLTVLDEERLAGGMPVRLFREHLHSGQGLCKNTFRPVLSEIELAALDRDRASAPEWEGE